MNGCVPRKETLPCDAPHELEQVLEGDGLALGQHQQHAVGGAQVQIGAEGVQKGPLKARTAVFRLGGKAHALQFACHHTLQPEGRRRQKGVGHTSFLHS